MLEEQNHNPLETGSNSGNGHDKPQNINNNKKKGLSDSVLKKAAIKSDGSPTKMAKILDVTPQTAYHHLQKPEIKKIILTEREKALKQSRLSRVKAYRRIDQALDATYVVFGKKTRTADHSVRLRAAQQTAEAFGDDSKSKENNGSAIIIQMPVIVVQGNPIHFKVGNAD